MIAQTAQKDVQVHFIKNRIGWIVQMRLVHTDGSVGPHTAIVQGIGSDGLTWIESNYRGDTTVRTRYETFVHFESSVLRDGVYEYSVYYIGGGP